MKLKQYPKYKDSGVQWIGEIPEEWEVKKVKHFSISIAGGTPDTTNTEYWDGNVPWLPSGMVHDKSISEEEADTFITLEGVSKSSAKWIKKNSVLVALTGATCANIAYLTFRATANQSVIGIQPNKKTDAKYIFYYLLSQREQILTHQTGGAQAGINKDEVINLICAFPEKNEQESISSYLDSKTSQIDQTIEKDKQLIELLKEKRTALINHVVTKGLDKNAKMKDSGIDWIGDIPEGWKIKRLKNIISDKKNSIKTGPFGTQLKIEEMEDSDIKIYNQKNVIRKDETLGENYISKEKYEELISFKTGPGELLISTRGTIGKCLLLSKNAEVGILHPCLMKIISNQQIIDNQYLQIVIEESDLVKIQFFLQSCATTIEVIYQDNLKELHLPIPTKPEQLQIVEYLDKETSKIDQIIKKIEEKIILMEEYKKSLIHHIVTGKVDVREAVA